MYLLRYMANQEHENKDKMCKKCAVAKYNPDYYAAVIKNVSSCILRLHGVSVSAIFVSVSDCYLRFK